MFIVAKEVVRELVGVVAGYLGPRRHLQVACGLALIFVLGWVAVGLLSLFGQRHKFSYPRVRGTILYEDGAPIPVKGLALQFVAEGEGNDASVASNLGWAVVDEKTGVFDCVLRVLPAQAKRSVKVAVGLASGATTQSDVVPSLYSDPKCTPLEVSLRSGAVTLRIKKPSS